MNTEPDVGRLVSERLLATNGAPQQRPVLDAEPTTEDEPGQTGEEALLDVEIMKVRRRKQAQAVLDAEDAPPLRWWGIDELLNSPSPVPLVQDFLYEDSLTRIFGPPGGGKTFVALDIAMHIALGRPWCDREVKQGAVVYVMAEGQAVNGDRIRAWMDHHNVNSSELTGKFITVPHAVLLAPTAMGAFLANIKTLGPALVLLDTKNAMQVGEENSATDAAVMRRALDAIRTSRGVCVALIDHTGHGVTERARGSSAVMAAMDTEISVSKDGKAVTATVTRDKAREPGTTVVFNLRWAPPAAVLVPTTTPVAPTGDEWSTHPIPAELLNANGRGGKHVSGMARYMAYWTAVGQSGLTRAEVLRNLGLGEAKNNGAAAAAWEQLRTGGWITPADGSRGVTGRHVWAGKHGAFRLIDGGTS